MQPDLAIRVDGLAKQYRVGETLRALTLREALPAMFSSRREGRPQRKTIWALDDISFDVRKGEVVGIIGRNGAGKSTLLKVLSRVTEPTRGEAEVRGRLGTLLEVGTGFHPELTGRENVFLNGIILGMRRREIARKFDEIIDFAGVAEFVDTPVKRFSSGMYVRLAFAVAAHLETEILIVDEVLAVGDYSFQQRCLGKMRDVAGEGRTVLFVSHNMPAIRTLCDRALLLEEGRLVQDGNVDEVVRRYLGGSTEADGIIPPDHPRSVGTGQVLVRRVSALTGAGTPSREIFFGQPFKIRVLCEAIEAVDDVAVEIGISNPDGLRVVTATSVDRARPVFSVERGLWEVEAEFDLTLLPGEYAIDVALHHWLESKLTIDWIERALTVRALDVPESGEDHYVRFSTYYSTANVRGYVRPETEWRELRVEITTG